jgi:hypothetical protein
MYGKPSFALAGQQPRAKAKYALRSSASAERRRALVLSRQTSWQFNFSRPWYVFLVRFWTKCRVLLHFYSTCLLSWVAGSHRYRCAPRYTTRKDDVILSGGGQFWNQSAGPSALRLCHRFCPLSKTLLCQAHEQRSPTSQPSQPRYCGIDGVVQALAFANSHLLCQEGSRVGIRTLFENWLGHSVPQEAISMSHTSHRRVNNPRAKAKYALRSSASAERSPQLRLLLREAGQTSLLCPRISRPDLILEELYNGV